MIRSTSYWKSWLLDDMKQQSNITRWSLQSLANICRNNDQRHNNIIGSSLSLSSPAQKISRHLLEDVSYRLARNYSYIQNIIDFIGREQQQNRIAVPTKNHNLKIKSVKKRLDSLLYVHYDTYKLCKQLLLPERNVFWDRFHTSDNAVIFATMEEIRSRHANTMEAIVDVLDVMTSVSTSNASSSIDASSSLLTIHNVSDTFIQGRLGIQLLCDHYVKLYKNQFQVDSTGAVVNGSTVLYDIIMDGITESKHMCDAHLQIYPEVYINIIDNGNDKENMNNNSSSSNNDQHHHMQLQYPSLIRSWMHHTIVELLKNAMASSVQKSNTLPSPIWIYVDYNSNDTYVTIDIADHGIGFMNEASIHNAFLLGHTSSQIKWDRINEQQSYAAVRSPLSSLGVGLHSSRNMIEHFYGTIQLKSNPISDNHNGKDGGCTATIRLCKDDTILERIPG